MGTLDLNFLVNFLAWLIVANFLFLIFRVFLFGSSPKNFIYKIHKKFFNVSNKDFARAHYKGIILHITLLVFFILLPYIVLRYLI